MFTAAGNPSNPANELPGTDSPNGVNQGLSSLLSYPSALGLLNAGTSSNPRPEAAPSEGTGSDIDSAALE